MSDATGPLLSEVWPGEMVAQDPDKEAARRRCRDCSAEKGKGPVDNGIYGEVTHVQVG